HRRREAVQLLRVVHADKGDATAGVLFVADRDVRDHCSVGPLMFSCRDPGGGRDMADGNITKDILYDAVAPDDFESMLELDRYGARSTAFDKIISATHDHFWDPLDKKYIDFDAPWDMENEALLPDDQVVSLGVPYVLEHLEKTGQKAK